MDALAVPAQARMSGMPETIASSANSAGTGFLGSDAHPAKTAASTIPVEHARTALHHGQHASACISWRTPRLAIALP